MLVAVTVGAYLPSLRNGFVNLDDPRYVYANPYVQHGLTWQGVRWAFTTFEAGLWHPFTWLSLMLATSLFGSHPSSYHCTNLLLHAANALLLFLVLLRLIAAARGNPKSEIRRPKEDRNPKSEARNPDELAKPNPEPDSGAGASPAIPSNPIIHQSGRAKLPLSRGLSSAAQPGSPGGSPYQAGSRSPTNPPIHSSIYPAFFVAALFALHPLHVESVAWAAERKDVLSTFFFLLTLWAYVRYAEERHLCVHRVSAVMKAKRTWCQADRPQRRDERREQAANPLMPSGAALRFYILALLFFALGLMSKPMLVTTPFVLLLLDYWPMQRVSSPWSVVSSLKSGAPRPDPKLRTADYGLPAVASTLRSGPATEDGLAKAGPRTILEKLPFLALALATALIALFAQRDAGALEDVARFPLAARVENAMLASVQYLVQTVWPANLAIFYPYPKTFSAVALALSAIVLLLLTAGALWSLRTRPYFFVGWIWYLVTLLPVIGLVQVGLQSRADRYTYIPLIGIFILLAWAASDLFASVTHHPPPPRLRRAGASPSAVPSAKALAEAEAEPLAKAKRITLPLVACAALSTCLFLTWKQISCWHDTETLLRHAIAVTRDNQLAHHNLGAMYSGQHRFDDAIAEYREAVRIAPDYALAQGNLGAALLAKGQYGESILHSRLAVKLLPHFAGAHRNLGTALGAQGHLDQAIVELHEAIRLAPADPQARYYLGLALASSGRVDEALIQCQEAARLAPANPAIQTALRSVQARQSQRSAP